MVVLLFFMVIGRIFAGISRTVTSKYAKAIAKDTVPDTGGMNRIGPKRRTYPTRTRTTPYMQPKSKIAKLNTVDKHKLKIKGTGPRGGTTVNDRIINKKVNDTNNRNTKILKTDKTRIIKNKLPVQKRNTKTEQNLKEFYTDGQYTKNEITLVKKIIKEQGGGRRINQSQFNRIMDKTPEPLDVDKRDIWGKIITPTKPTGRSTVNKPLSTRTSDLLHNEGLRPVPPGVIKYVDSKVAWSSSMFKRNFGKDLSQSSKNIIRSDLKSRELKKIKKNESKWYTWFNGEIERGTYKSKFPDPLKFR